MATSDGESKEWDCGGSLIDESYEIEGLLVIIVLQKIAKQKQESVLYKPMTCMYHELRIMFIPILCKNNPKTTTKTFLFSFIFHTLLAMQLSSGQSHLKENLQSFT